MEKRVTTELINIFPPLGEIPKGKGVLYESYRTT